MKWKEVERFEEKGRAVRVAIGELRGCGGDVKRCGRKWRGFGEQSSEVKRLRGLVEQSLGQWTVEGGGRVEEGSEGKGRGGRG